MVDSFYDKLMRVAIIGYSDFDRYSLKIQIELQYKKISSKAVRASCTHAEQQVFTLQDAS